MYVCTNTYHTFIHTYTYVHSTYVIPLVQQQLAASCHKVKDVADKCRVLGNCIYVQPSVAMTTLTLGHAWLLNRFGPIGLRNVSTSPDGSRRNLCVCFRMDLWVKFEYRKLRIQPKDTWCVYNLLKALASDVGVAVV